MTEENIRIEDILSIFKKRIKIILLITIAATILSAVVSFFVIKPQYEASTKLFIGKEENSNKEAYNSNDIVMYQKLMKTYSEIIKTKDLVETALEDNRIDKSAGEVIRNLSVVPSADTQILEIKIKDKNKEESLALTEAITNEFIKKSKELIPNGNVNIIEKVKLPERAMSPNKKLNIAIGFLLGFMVSIGLVFLLEYLDNTFKSRDELERALQLPVIGIIPEVEGE